MEPTQQVLDTFVTVANITEWLPMSGPFKDEFLKAIGIPDTEPTRSLAEVEEEDIHTIRTTLTVEGRALSPAEKGKVVLAWRVARMAVGTVKTKAQIEKEEAKLKEEADEKEKRKLAVLQSHAAATQAASSVTTLATVNAKTVPLSEVVDQLSSQVAPLLPMTDIVKYHAKYEEKVEGPCPQEECPTDRQISCVKFLIDQGDNPMVDLGLYTNYANRLRRRLVFSGFVPAEDGTLRKVEIRGPPDIETWTRHYRVYRANMIMLDAMGLNPFDVYNAKLRKFHTDFGSQCWLLLYQADVRFRGEHILAVYGLMLKEAEAIKLVGHIP